MHACPHVHHTPIGVFSNTGSGNGQKQKPQNGWSIPFFLAGCAEVAGAHGSKLNSRVLARHDYTSQSTEVPFVAGNKFFVAITPASRNMPNSNKHHVLVACRSPWRAHPQVSCIHSCDKSYLL
jgi:hypothetical protein